jgi:hypothetical protein
MNPVIYQNNVDKCSHVQRHTVSMHKIPRPISFLDHVKIERYAYFITRENDSNLSMDVISCDDVYFSKFLLLPIDRHSRIQHEVRDMLSFALHDTRGTIMISIH